MLVVVMICVLTRVYINVINVIIVNSNSIAKCDVEFICVINKERLLNSLKFSIQVKRINIINRSLNVIINSKWKYEQPT